MLRKVIPLILSIFSIGMISCASTKPSKVYSLESDGLDAPALVRRTSDGVVLESIPADKTHQYYGCASWEDWDKIVAKMDECKE